MQEALRRHWPEYAMEALELALFMAAACAGVALLEHPASPIHQALPDPTVRRILMGLAMGSTAIAIIYSPFGKRSGAHFNPAVTATFYRLGKIAPWDAAFYVIAQCAGGLAGVTAAHRVLGDVLAHPNVNFAVTVPGTHGAGAALVAEIAIAFLQMTTVLVASNTPALARHTGRFAGTLVATWIAIEAPWSGMSMNPARTLASAVPAGVYTGFWLYVLAPLTGMLLAAEVFTHHGRLARVFCAKLHHDNAARCIFCERAS